MAGKIERAHSISYWRVETVRWHVDPTEFLKWRFIRIGPLASFGRGLVIHTEGKANAVLQGDFGLTVALAPDREAREILIGVVDLIVAERHRNENLVVAWTDDDVQACVVPGNFCGFHVGPLQQ